MPLPFLWIIVQTGGCKRPHLQKAQAQALFWSRTRKRLLVYLQHFKCQPCNMVTCMLLPVDVQKAAMPHQPPCAHGWYSLGACSPACLPDEPPHLRHALEGDLCLCFMAWLFACSDWQCLDAGGQLRRGLGCSCLARRCIWCLARRVLRPNACAGRVCAAHALPTVARLIGLTCGLPALRPQCRQELKQRLLHGTALCARVACEQCHNTVW